MVRRAVRWTLMSCIWTGSLVAVHATQEKQSEKPAISSFESPSGAELYNKRCAVCHGNDLKGTGPFPPPYRTPPDLTTLARRHGGEFPAEYVSKVLKNGVRLPAHGPAEMPVWGNDFEAGGRLNKTQIAARIKDLTNYIKSLQQK